MPDLETLARYCAANAETDRLLLELAMEAAQRSLENAGVARRTADSLYDLAVYLLGTYYFDHREAAQQGGSAEIALGVTAIANQLRLEDPEETEAEP